MAQCKDCIHWDKCSKKDGKTRYYGKQCAANNVEILCEWFVNTADVVPKSEVAREIFEELEPLMKIYTFPVVKMGVIEIVKEPFWCIEPNDFDKLKKKYTESEDTP